MIALDTSVVVRYLTGLPHDQAGRARLLLEGADRLSVPIIVLLETGHVLRSRYGVRHPAVVDTLLDFVAMGNIEIVGLPKSAVMVALARARQLPGAPFSDALIVAMAREAGATAVATFDHGMGSHGLDVIEP